MKTLVTFILFLLMEPAYSITDNPYDKAMKDAMNNLNKAASIEDFQQAANQFDRIGKVAGENWLPFYHAAYAKIMIAAMEQDPAKKDPFLDAAQQDLNALEALDHDDVERMVLQGFLYMISMSVDASRGMTLGQQCAMILNQAYAMNDQNPRAVLMLAQFKHGSASYMGEDTSEACAMFDQALALFGSSNGEARDDFSPQWGKSMASMMQQQCEN